MAEELSFLKSLLNGISVSWLVGQQSDRGGLQNGILEALSSNLVRSPIILTKTCDYICMYIYIYIFLFGESLICLETGHGHFLSNALKFTKHDLQPIDKVFDIFN